MANNNTPPKNLAELIAGSIGGFSQPKGVSTRNIVAERAGYAPLAKLGKYDVGMTPAIYETAMFSNPRLAQQYYRADQQTAGQQLFNGFVSRAASIPVKMGEGYGYLVGGVEALISGDMNDMFDNGIVQLFTNIDNKLKEKLPVYQSKAYTEGSWMRKMGTTSFWATDGFDGLAFLASAYLPGGLFSKVGSVSKWLMGVERLGLLGKASRGLGTALKGVREATGLSTKAALITAWNTATEAGFEAHDTNKMLREQLAQQKGYASFAEVPVEEQESIRDQAAQGAARTYMWNTAALLVPNFLQTKWLFGNKAIKPDDIIDKVRKGKLAKDLPAKSKLAYLSKFGEGMASEGLWEENIQTSIQQYESRRAKGLAEDDAFSGPLFQAFKNGLSFAKTLATLGFAAPEPGSEEDEAGSAIALGGLIGGGMSLFSQYLENSQLNAIEKGAQTEWEKFRATNRASSNLLVKDVKTPYKIFGNTTIKDEEGKDVTVPQMINPKTGKREHDPKKWTQIMLAQAMNAQTIAEAEAGFVSNDPIWQEYNKQMGIMSHVYRLAASGMSKEDVTDIINYDLENISDEAKQLGITEDMDSLRSDMLAYLDIIYQQKTEALKGIDASQSGDVSFANYLHRNLYYLSAKEHALSKFSDVKDQAGLQALKEDNAEMRNWLTNSRSKVKEQYLKEVAAAQSLEKETKRLREESQKEGVSEEAKQKLGEDYMKQKYMLEELMDIFGTTPLEYGEEAKDLHSPAIVSSASFRTQEASQLLKSNSRVQRKATALGTNRALSEELSEAAEDFSNSGDLGDVDRMIDSMSRLSPVTDVHTKSVNKALAKLQDVRKQTGDSAQALLDLTSPFDIEDKINEQTFTEEERAFLEESQVDPTDSNAIADAANAKIAELETLMEQIDIRSNTLSSIPIKPETAVSKFSWDAMVEEYVGDKFTAAESLLESFDEAPTEFLRGAEVNEMIQQLLLVSKVFKERKDVKKKLAERTVKKAEELLDRLKEVRRAVAMNNARRSALQAAAEIHYTNNSLSALGFSQGEFDRNGGFYRLLLTTFDNNDDKVKEIEEVLATASSGSLQALLLYVATSAPKDALNTFLAQNNAAYKNLAQQVDPNGATKILRDVFNNPLKYGPIILQSVLGGKVGFNDYNSPFFAYSKDKDIVKLRYALEEKSQGKPLPGMTAEETDFIFRKIDLMMDLITRRDIHFSLNSTLDAKKAYEAELSLEEEFENVESGGIPPSIQQSIAFREVLRNLFLPASGQKGNEITVLKGVLGSGKSLVGAKAAVSMWRHLTGATDDQIFAFGHSETSSEIIAKAIYGESSTVHSAEEFLTADLTKVKLVVIDEAMAIDRETWTRIYGRVLTENATRTDRSNKIHILALGDPAQFTKEREELTFVGGNLNSDTKDTSPLSVVYRTSVSSIVDMVMTFKDKPYNISSINPTASHTAADLLTQENIDNFYGVNGGSEASLIELLNKPSGKSRLLIVNNQQEVERFRKLVPNSVKILTYYDAQSTQADQAFIYLTQRLPDIDGNNISDALMNKFMYTMIGRAKQSVFIANPELRVENPIINPDLAQSKSSLEEDINFNLKQYQGGKKIHGRMIEVLYPNEEIKKSPKKNASGTKPESTTVADESIDGIGGQEVEIDENSGETLEQNLIEPKPVTTEVNEAETESGMEVTFEHSFMFPTNRFPNSQFGSLAASVPPGSELRLVVVSTPSSKFPFRIDAVAQTVNGNWVNVAVLSGEELSSSPQMSEILAKASEVSSRISNLPLHADGFAWKPEYDAATVAFGTTQSAASVQYQYIPVGEDGTSMEEALEIFYEGFYKNAKAGKGVEPKVPLHNAKDGKINWAALAKYVKFHIFSASDVRNLDNTRFLPKLGVPYMIIEEPTEAGVAKAEPQYIRFEPRKLLPSDQLHVTLSRTLDLVGQLGALDPRFAFGKEEFTQLIGHYKDNALTATAEGPQRNETSALEVLKTSPLLVGKTDSELSAMVPILDELVLNYLVGAHSDTLLFSKAKAEEAFKANQTAYKGFKQYKNSNRYYLETHDGKKATGFVLDYEHSPAQKALNAIASANSSVEVESNGVVNNILIRVEHMTTRRSGKRETSKFGKSLMSYEASEGNFWNHYRSWLIKRLDEAGVTEAEMKDEETGKFLPGYLLEQGYKKMINSAPNLTEEQKVEAIATIEDTRQQLEAKYKVDPITNSTLSALLSSADIRLPLIKQDFNLAGRKLADEASRDKLNSLVNGRVRKVVPSHVTARLTYTSTVVSPEQPLAQKSIPTSSRSWQQLTVEDIDQTAPVNYGSFLDENNPLTKFILAALPQSRFKGVFPLKARPKDWPNVEASLMATYFFDGEAHIVYDPSAGKNIFEESRDVINTLLQHELIHALVNWELANNPEGEFAKTMSALQDILDKEIKRRKVDPRKVYQPTPSDLNLYEFVASFSNPDFITFARSVEIVKDSKSLWKAILDAILDFLGVTQSNVYDAGFAALERLYSIPKEGSGQAIGIEQPLNLDAVYEELSAKVSQSGDASTQTTLDTIYYEGEESDQQKIELMRKAVDGASKGTFAMATSIASVIGADITKFANLDAFAQWIKPGVEAKELKKNKTAYTTLYELFSNALAYPSLRIFKNLDSTVRTYLVAKENNIPLSARSELGKIVSTIYKYGLSRKEKDDLNTAFARKSAEFVEASLAAKEDYLVTLLLSSEAERAKEQQVELVLFTNRVNKVTNLINELGPEIEKNYKQAFKIEQLTSKLAAGKNVGTVKFIDNNFSSVDHYRVAREWMYNAMHTMIATNGVAGVQKTRREIVHNLYVALVARVAALKSQVDLGVVATGSITPALEHGALSSMLAQYDGAPLLYYMLTEIYPNWTVDSIEDVEEDILAEEIDDLTVGIKKETEEADRVDVETRLSDSVKEFLSFIKNPTEGATKQYLGSKHTFFLAAKLVTSYLDTSRLDLWDQQVKAVFRDFLSDNEKAVITKLDLLVREAKSEPNRKDIAVWVFEDSINGSKIGIGYVPNANISNMSALEVKNLAEQNRFLIRSWTFADALEQVNKWGADINEADFNQIVRQAKAVNTLRELHNSLSSLTEKNYMVGSVENDMGTISTSYMNASGFGLDKSLNSQVRAALHAFDQKYGIEQLIIQAKDIYDLAGQNDAEAIHKLINFLGLSGLSNYLDIKARKSSEVFAAIRGFFERARDKSPDDTIDDFLADQRSFFRSLTNVIKYNVDALRQTSIIDSAGHRIHKLVPKSYFYEVVEYFTKAYRAKEPKIGGVTGSLSWMLKATPQHLENDFYSHSSFVNGLQRIYGVAEHDASKNENSLKVTGFSRENDRQFFIRQFVHGFLDMIDSYSSDVTYGQFLYQPGVKPRIPLVRVRVLNKDEVITSLADMARQLSAYPDSSSMKTKVSSKVGPGINASFVVEALKLDSNPEKAAKIAYKMMQDASKEYLRSVLSNTIPVPATLDKVAKKLQSDSAHGRFDYLAEALKKIPSRVANRKLSEEGGTEYDADTLYNLLEPLAELFYTNNYVNSFFLNQLFTGPYDFYKSTDDIVKRISGVLAPGIKPFVDPRLGSQEEFSVVVFADVEREKSAIEQLLDAILDPPSANYTSEQRANDIEEVTRFFSTFASTDSQGFMSEKRWNDLAKGYGAAWNLDNVMKPVYFGVHEMDMEVDGKPTKFPVPVFSKLSSIKVSGELAKRFPAMAKLKEYMETHNIDEIHSSGAVKLGRDTNLLTVEDIRNNIAPDGKKLMLSNRNYRMQFNPKSKVDSSVSIFTQLMYFMNILDTNVTEVEQAYAAVAMLMENSLVDLMDEFSTDGQLNPAKIKASVANTMTSPGTERLAQLLRAGVSLNNPTVANKAFTQLASIFEKSIQKIKFPGAKLVLQTDEFIEKNADPGVETASNVRERLKYVKTSQGGFAAEVVVPQTMLTPDLKEALARGEELYLTGDYFGFRIPSTELHSAVPLKVVGVYDSKGTNVIIAPYELVYLHGSDFDVDSLFVVKRSMFSKQEREILGIETTVADLPIGYEQKGRKLVFSADAINSYRKKIDSLRTDLNKKGFDNPELAQVILGETKKLNRLEKKIEEKFAKNTIFELMMNVITKPENRKRMMTPIVMNSFNDLDNKLSVASYLQELGLWESKLTKDLSRADYALEAHKFVQDGAVLTGVFANNIKVLSYLYRAGQNFQPAKVKDNLVIRFNVAGKEEVFDRISDYDRETGTLMWQYQDGLVNLAIDNLNEQTLSKLGVNLQTGNAFVALLGLGFPLRDTVLLMKTELAELISKNRPFDKVAYLNAYKKQNDLRVTTKVLSTKDLEKAATKGLDLSKSEDREIQAGIVDILVKAFTMGNSAFKLSRVLKTIRTVPGTPEKLYQWLDAVEDVFGSVPYELSRGIRKYNSPTELREAHKSNVKTNPVSNSFAYDIPNLLPSTPHVLSSIRSTLILKQVAQSAIFKLSDNHREFAKSILKSMEFKGFGLDKITIEDIIEELEHFLFASLNLERIKEVKDYQYRQRKTRLTHFSAFANYLADKITKAMEVEKALQLLDKTYVINQFLENLVINRRNGIVNIRLANAISPDAADVAAIRHGFDRLPQDMQEDLITYLIIATGFKLSATSFAPYVDEAKYVSKDKVFSEASEKFATSVEMRDMYTSPFRVALAFKYADKLPYFNKNQRKYMKYANDTGGYESGVYYDMKMDQAEMPEELRTFPEFVAIINWPNEEAGRHWKEYEVYRRINKPVKDSLRPIFYQKIGRKTFDGYYVDPTTYSIANNLPSDIRRVFVYDLDNPFTFNKKVFDRLREDQEVLFASYDDPMGVRSYRATIVAKHKVDLGFGDFKYTFTLKDKKYLSEKLPADDVKIDNTPDTETQDPKSTFAAARDFVDPRIKKATTGYSPEFQAFIKDSERVKEDPSDKNFYLVDNGDRVLRVSADMGPINKLRARPFEKDHEERARAIVESAWKERDPNHKLKVKGLEGEYTKDAAFDALVEKFVNIADRGTLLHKYLHLATVTSPAVQERIVSEINELQSRLRYNASWLVQDGGVEKVFKKAGLNIFDDVTSESVDRIYSELSIVDTVYTKWGGTADLIYQKANGLFGIRDFKTGWGFNNVEARAMFKYGGGATKNIMQTPRNTAKLQLMLYAFLMKIKNPSAKFDTLEITWIPDPEKVFFNDPDRFVEVRDYLNMIHSYIKREMPEVYAKMKQEMTKENFAKLWDFNEYEASFMLNSTLAEQKKEGKSLLKEKLDELRMFTFFSLAEHEGPSKKTQKTKYEKQAAIIFKEVMDLVNDIGVKEHEINDISFLSLWLSSNAHQLSGYIQLYDKMLKKAKAKVDARKTVYRTKFKHRMEAWLDDHHRVYGKSPLEYIPFTKGLLNFYRSEELFGWLYKDVKDKDGYIVGKQIRSSEADWKEAEEAFPKYSKWAERKAFAKFLTDTYDSFFVDEKSEYGVAVANRTATYRDKTDPETGEIVEVQVSNLDLQNEYRRHRDAASFVYETGWFPKVPKLLEEIGTLFTKEYWQEVWRRQFTLFNEANFDQEFNNIEVIPMSYLGNEYINSSGNFSVNAEVQFDKFVTRMLMKEEAEDVYGFGKAMMLYLQAKTKDGSLVYKNTIEYMQTALEMQVRGRKQYDVPFLSRNSNVFRSANGDLNRVNWAKVIRAFRSAAAAPIMWLKPLSGTANGIFTYMYTLKEAIKNDIMRSGRLGSWVGVNGDEYNFGVKDLMWATNEWRKLQIAAMKGELKDNKLFMIAKHLGYMPSNFGWSEDAANLISTRNKIFTQSSMYMFHSFFEEGVALISLGAQLKAMKTRDGKTLWEHYDLVEQTDADGMKYKVVQWDGFIRGKVRMKDGSLRDLTEPDENERRRMFHVYERMHGGYRDDERTRASYYLIGEVLLQLKTYLPNVLKNVMGSKGLNYAYGSYVDAPSYRQYQVSFGAAQALAAQTGDDIPIKEWVASVMEGRWRVLAGVFLSWLPIKASIGDKASNKNIIASALGINANESYKLNELSAGQKEQLIDAVVTFTMWLGLLGGYMLMFGGADDDDILKKYTRRIHQNFFQQVSPIEVARDVISPSGFVPPSLRQGWGLMQSTAELTGSLFLAGVGDEDAWTQKGTLRGWSQFQRHVPFLSSYKDIAALFEDLSGEDYSVRIRR